VEILIIAVGRAKAGPWRALYDDYAKRITWPLTLSEIELGHTLPPAERRVREGQALRARVPDRTILVALDGGGKTLTSAAFADRLRHWRDTGGGRVAFLIGGPDGHDPRTLAEADLVLSLGALTWPHLMARVMLVEQIYRAQQILAGHPYHRA
jgi:23S rRNA (pseudouridine1915-N3)-methyltransferase